MFSQNGAGHLVEEAYFNEAGKPTLSKEGYAECSTTYNDYGNEGLNLMHTTPLCFREEEQRMSADVRWATREIAVATQVSTSYAV